MNKKKKGEKRRKRRRNVFSIINFIQWSLHHHIFYPVDDRLYEIINKFNTLFCNLWATAKIN